MFKFIRPEFFDIFGVFVWIFFIAISGRALYIGEAIPHWAVAVLLIISILGFLIDGVIVYKTYIKRRL